MTITLQRTKRELQMLLSGLDDRLEYPHSDYAEKDYEADNLASLRREYL